MTRDRQFDAAPQIEGYDRPAANLDEIDLIVSASPAWFLGRATDSRGGIGPAKTGRFCRRELAWQTAAPPTDGPVTFCFSAAADRHPATLYPAPSAALAVNGNPVLEFPVGECVPFTVHGARASLEFQPRRIEAPVESYHRQVAAGGQSGLYRLRVEAGLVRAGSPATIRVALEAQPDDVIAWFAVLPRRDMLSLTLQTLAEEVRQLQADVIHLKQTVDRLGRQMYAEVLWEKLASERLIATTSVRGHFHPPVITALRNGHVLLAYREGTDHIGDNGRAVVLRSRDGGRTWGDRLVVASDPVTDHRILAITELDDGTLIATDSIDGSYDQDHNYSFGVPTKTASYAGRPGPLYLLRSGDGGATWAVLAGPLFAGIRSLEVTKPIIQLRSGRLLMPMYYLPEELHGQRDAARNFVITVQASDDGGKTWRELHRLEPRDPPLTGEHTLVETRGGRLLMMIRSEAGQYHANGLEGPLFQSVSDDGGLTWSAPEPTRIPSLGTPAHLLSLRDGRVLCTYGARKYPAIIGVCVSRDEGRTWDAAARKIITDDLGNWDSAYPSSAELADGTILTAYYNAQMGRYFIAVHRYRLPPDMY